jgi:Holliday junction resolvase RusA-like endonuclease
MSSFQLTVYGEAQPAGSKRGFKNPRTGAVIVTDANPKSKGWKAQVAQAAGEKFEGELLDGPLFVAFTFRRPRPRSHYGTGRNRGFVKPSAPAFPTTRPDALKLARGVEDALTGVVWTDDARIVTELLEKRWGEPARVEIEIKEL